MFTLDALLIFLHLGVWFGHTRGFIANVPRLVSLFGDTSSLSELWGYLQWIVTIAALGSIYIRQRVALFLGLAVIYAIILCDDSLGLHERGGMLLANQFPDFPRLGLSRHVVGELTVWLVLGVMIIWIAARSIKSTPREWYFAAMPFLVTFCGLLAFAVALDAAEVPLLRLFESALRELIGFWLATIETMGEVLLTSATAASAIASYAAYGHIKVSTPPTARIPGQSVRSDSYLP